MPAESVLSPIFGATTPRFVALEGMVSVKVTAQEEYGIRCLMQLMRAGDDDTELSIPDVAVREGLSVAYVGKILSVLRQGGLVTSSRGRTGGYRLARGPEDIRLADVMAVLGEPLFDQQEFCQRHTGADQSTPCVHAGGCSLRGLWGTLEFWMQQVFEELTLADLALGETRVTHVMQKRMADLLANPPTPPLAVVPESSLVAIKD